MTHLDPGQHVDPEHGGERQTRHSKAHPQLEAHVVKTRSPLFWNNQFYLAIETEKDVFLCHNENIIIKLICGKRERDSLILFCILTQNI